TSLPRASRYPGAARGKERNTKKLQAEGLRLSTTTSQLSRHGPGVPWHLARDPSPFGSHAAPLLVDQRAARAVVVSAPFHCSLSAVCGQCPPRPAPCGDGLGPPTGGIPSDLSQTLPGSSWDSTRYISQVRRLLD